ncbi:AAA family ATPase [Dactylosporangium fulvum]|uniref:ATP-binding protein n=1 Tax=Dactylosporangium fulvum TaxID=53359 RepID=A0ABY5W869_9ACTN|nr:ATP-binding protein [Dactylosporangium fulvum]UWP86245.1 ATP-binding protein [Dactylosporangium fulvum]
MATLMLICGLPGAGKTTLARRLAAALPAVRLCPDEWLTDLGLDLFDEPVRERLEHRFKTLALELVGLGQSVILEFGFWARGERDELRSAARALGAKVELHFLDEPLEELARRTAARGEPVIDLEMLREFATVFEQPTAEELALFDGCACPPAASADISDIMVQ